ncbi:MAG: TIGR03619 family F420-dependent LLM class oxidoreductase [Acidimicrobiia bacterium]
MRFGLILPHFGEHASRELLIDRAKEIEEMGFDSVWVRDHLIYTPHGMESPDRTFLEPLLTLAAVAGTTNRLRLGTAVLVPIRWPIKLAQNLATLDFLAPGRVVAGMGLGNTRMDFEATGLDDESREQIMSETIEIARRLWTEDAVTHHGEAFAFEDVTLYPKPASPIPFVYGGTTRAAVRRAVSMMDGWIPGRIPLATLDARLAYLRELADEVGKKMMLGTIPLVIAHPDRDRAREGVEPEKLGVSSAGAKYWVKPPSGEFRTIEDLEGLLLAGDRDDILGSVAKFADRGLDLVVLDLRLQFDRFWEQVELLADWVLPEFDSEAVGSPGSEQPTGAG